tara:strand:+ start:171 stop:395 length:225 start_codon:yes stop_codon:yes gene_type:complete
MANKLNKTLHKLAKKYYGTEDLSALQPYQLDKLTTWVTWSEDRGKNKSRKAEMALRKNKKFRGKRHKSKSTFVE